MDELRERLLQGRACLAAMTELLQRCRAAHPTDGLFEAADLQWWWRRPRSTDSVDQLVWFDRSGRPEAAVVATDWEPSSAGWQSGIGLTPIFLADAPTERVARMIDRAIGHADVLEFGSLDIEVAVGDTVTASLLATHGFAENEPGVVESWIDADAVPAPGRLPADYRLCARRDLLGRPHHLIARNGPDVQRRLRQTSLYRDDLDLVVLDGHGSYAAYGLFWFDPTTRTGLVEPMRTEDAHQRRGLARHVLTAGLERLVAAGAERIKICFEAANPASSRLYVDVGFVPIRETIVHTRPAAGL